MNEEARLKTLILQVLSLVGMVMFWNPKVAAVVALLQSVITDYWDQFVPLLRKASPAKRKAVLKAGGEILMADMLKAAKSAKVP